MEIRLDAAGGSHVDSTPEYLSRIGNHLRTVAADGPGGVISIRAASRQFIGDFERPARDSVTPNERHHLSLSHWWWRRSSARVGWKRHPKSYFTIRQPTPL